MMMKAQANTPVRNILMASSTVISESGLGTLGLD